MSITSHLSAIASGLALIRDLDGMTKQTLIELGAPADYADELLRVHSVYFGETAFTGKQRNARRTRHDLLTLLRIEKHVGRVKTQRAAWDLRVELCATPAERVDAVARQRLKEINPPKPAQDGVRVTRGTGKWRLTITGDSSRIADIWDGFGDTLESFEEAFFTGTARPAVTANVVVTLDALDEILDGDGEEVTLKLTNGSTMTGAEFINRMFRDRYNVGLFHPEKGPVNLYRAERFANDKQRLLCMMENPTCAWPGCNCPATQAQFHHIIPFKNGGNTNAANLVTLCAYHNAVNSDSGPNINGKMARIGGQTAWISPYGRVIYTGMYAAA